MEKHEVILRWSEDDKAYIAENPCLPGCMADGPTAEETLVNLDRVTGEWIDTARELGRPVPEWVRAWDPDYTKVTPQEAREIAEAEASGFIDETEIDWNDLSKYAE